MAASRRDMRRGSNRSDAVAKRHAPGARDPASRGSLCFWSTSTESGPVCTDCRSLAARP